MLNSDLNGLDGDLIAGTLAQALTELPPDDVAERRRRIAEGLEPQGCVSFPEPGGWLRFEWGGRLLVRVPVTALRVRRPACN